MPHDAGWVCCGIRRNSCVGISIAADCCLLLLLPLQAASRLAAPYAGAWDCAVTSWRQEGSRVFVRGLGATMGRGFVVNAAIFAAFEACMDGMSG